MSLITLVFGSIVYQFVHTPVALWFRQQYRSQRQILKRTLLMLPVHILINSHTILLFFMLGGLLGFHRYPWERLPWCLLLGMMLNVVLVCINEGVYAFEQWESKLQETKELKKANLQSQFESLQQQINPHFLFNSLNSLSSLIEEDPEQARKFVDELGSVYRYLLRSNESELTTLAGELRFANSYFHLLRTRYGEAIRMEQAIDPAFEEYLLPPLTLQLLLENVVKHNVILPEQPVLVHLETRHDGRLLIRNNVQRRPVRAPSGQVGLANIAKKYSLLGEGEIEVSDDDQYFTVSLPLLPKAVLV